MYAFKPFLEWSRARAGLGSWYTLAGTLNIAFQLQQQLLPAAAATATATTTAKKDIKFSIFNNNSNDRYTIKNNKITTPPQ